MCPLISLSKSHQHSIVGSTLMTIPDPKGPISKRHCHVYFPPSECLTVGPLAGTPLMSEPQHMVSWKSKDHCHPHESPDHKPGGLKQHKSYTLRSGGQKLKFKRSAGPTQECHLCGLPASSISWRLLACLASLGLQNITPALSLCSCVVLLTCAFPSSPVVLDQGPHKHHMKHPIGKTPFPDKVTSTEVGVRPQGISGGCQRCHNGIVLINHETSLDSH